MNDALIPQLPGIKAVPVSSIESLVAPRHDWKHSVQLKPGFALPVVTRTPR